MLALVFCLVLLACTGCNDEGIVLELALPAAPQQSERLEICIDQQYGEPAEHRSHGVYRIRFERQGDKYVARVPSTADLQRWRRYAIVTPDKRHEWLTEFRVADSGWESARVTEKPKGGGVRSYSVDEGSVYWMEIEMVDVPHRSEAQP